MKKIFIGGYGRSGSRVAPMILKKAGYYVGPVNASYDFGAIDFVRQFIKWMDQKSEGLKSFIDKYSVDKDSWAFKHGHMMLMVPTLKSWYPDSKFILCVRHPVDQMSRWNAKPWQRWFGKNCKNIVELLEFYRELHEKALENTDFIFRLEDICFDSKNAIKKLLNFAEIEDDVDNYLNLIKPSRSLGCGRRRKLNNPIIEKLGYSPYK